MRAGQHRMAEIAANQCAPGFALESDQQVAGAAREIEDPRAGTIENIAYARDRAFSPVPVDVRRKQMIGKIVTGSHAAEHRPYPARRFLFRTGTFGRCAVPKTASCSGGPAVCQRAIDGVLHGRDRYIRTHYHFADLHRNTK